MNSQPVRFRDHLVHIQTVMINGIECLCLDDVRQRFPSITAFSLNGVQIGFLRDEGGHYLQPLRIRICPDQTINALEPIDHDGSENFTQMERRMQEMNQKMDLILANTQETLVRIKHAMTLMYELHEYTTPRYFFILPTKAHSWSSINTVRNWFQLTYRLYFLCECSNDPEKLHLAPHEGYIVKKPTEFVATYGSYLRTTLNIARNLLSVGGLVIAQSVNYVGHALPACIQETSQYAEMDNKLDVVEKILDHHDQALVPIDSSSMQNALSHQVPLQGAQLRELEVFLDHVDQTHSLGNLYRIITDDGHVRWVCLEHYDTLVFNSKMSEYIRQCEAMGGTYNSTRKELILKGNLTTKNIETLCHALTKGFAVLILVLEKCSINRSDLDRLFDTVINQSSIHRLILISVEVVRWMGTSKYICDRMMVYFTNQSLSVRYSRGDQDGGTRAVRRLLRQNKICRSLEFHGYDLANDDRILTYCLNKEISISTLIINHPIPAEFFHVISNGNPSLHRLKLRYSFEASAQIYHLCQALESNRSLTELDIIDQISANDSMEMIELLTIVQKHPTLQHVQLHLSAIQPSTSMETCLINSLKDFSFITHLRLSDSTVSHCLTQALLDACQERHVLSYLELFHCQIEQADRSILEAAYGNDSLAHLVISDQSYWVVALAEICQQLKNEYPVHKNLKLEQKIEQFSSDSTVSLDRMDLIDPDIETVAEQAIIRKQCRSLSLQYNQITLIGISILSEALMNNSVLEALYLSYNHISDDGIRCLSQVLSNQHQSLKILVLQKNRITNLGIKYLAEMLKSNRSLIRLDLADNSIGDEGVRILADVLTDRNATLKTLVLSANKLVTDTSVQYLISMVQQNQHLKELWIANCRLSTAGKRALTKVERMKQDFIFIYDD